MASIHENVSEVAIFIYYWSTINSQHGMCFLKSIFTQSIMTTCKYVIISPNLTKEYFRSQQNRCQLSWSVIRIWNDSAGNFSVHFFIRMRIRCMEKYIQIGWSWSLSINSDELLMKFSRRNTRKSVCERESKITINKWRWNCKKWHRMLFPTSQSCFRKCIPIIIRIYSH